MFGASIINFTVQSSYLLIFDWYDISMYFEICISCNTESVALTEWC